MFRIIRRSKFISIQPDIEQAVRRGDLYGIIIEFHFEKREYERCLDYLKKMKERGIVIAPYVDKQIVYNFLFRLTQFTSSWASPQKRKIKSSKKSFKICHDKT